MNEEEMERQERWRRKVVFSPFIIVFFFLPFFSFPFRETLRESGTDMEGLKDK